MVENREITITKQRIGKVEKIELARHERESGNQEIAFLADRYSGRSVTQHFKAMRFPAEGWPDNPSSH